MGTGQVGTTQTSLALGTSQVVELVRILDIWTVALLEASLKEKLANDKVVMSTLKNISFNIAALPNKYLHVL